MGALQPGMPSPAMIPHNWHRTIIDLKYWVFTIPLHPNDAPKFAFSVPSINISEPHKRYHWVVLPQGMKNSPTICQCFVAKALSPVREQFAEALICHYMDDILTAAESDEYVRMTLAFASHQIKQAGLQIAPEKIQQVSP